MNQPIEVGSSRPGGQSVSGSMAAPALQPCLLLAAAIVEFQSDLAAADGWSYRRDVADPRLGALVARSVANLMELYGEQCSQEEQTTITALRWWLMQGCDAALGPSSMADSPST